MKNTTLPNYIHPGTARRTVSAVHWPNYASVRFLLLIAFGGVYKWMTN